VSGKDARAHEPPTRVCTTIMPRAQGAASGAITVKSEEKPRGSGLAGFLRLKLRFSSRFGEFLRMHRTPRPELVFMFRGFGENMMNPRPGLVRGNCDATLGGRAVLER
jgi:hypothetical protein